MSVATVRSRRTLIGLCLAVGGSYTVLASFNYMLTPMLVDLELSQEQAGVALAIPPIASLLVVFLAGRLGDNQGHRRVMTWMIAMFIFGSALVAIAEGIPAVVMGLLIEGIAATAIQIVGFGLLSNRFQDPKARAAAFGTFGMVYPFVWLSIPVLTGWLVGEVSWRWVPASWVAFGVMMLVATRVLLPSEQRAPNVGELWTPILAGATVAAAVQSLNRLSDDGFFTVVTLGSIAATVVLAVVCGIVLRRSSAPTFSLTPLRVRNARSLLIVVLVIPLINTVFLMTMSFQYLYGLSILNTAIVMIPAQAGAVIGARFIAAPMMRKFGVARTALLMFVALAVVMPLALGVTPGAPIWVPIAYIAIYTTITVSASITVTSGVLVSAPGVDSGQLSAYRGSAQALGAVLAVVIMNPIVFLFGQMFLTRELQENGLTSAEAADLAGRIQSEATSPEVMSQYALPLPSGLDVGGVMLESVAKGLQVNGLLGVILAIVCVVLLVRIDRDERKVEAKTNALK